MRKTESRELLRVARRRQRDVLCDVMLSARSAGDEAGHFGAELEGHGEIPVAAGFSSAVERVGGGFCARGEGGARGAGLGFAHGAVSPLLSGTRTVSKCAAFSRIERDQLGELDGADPPSLRQRTSEPRHVPTKKIFRFHRIDGSLTIGALSKTQTQRSTSESPTRRILPDSVEATRVLVATR